MFSGIAPAAARGSVMSLGMSIQRARANWASKVLADASSSLSISGSTSFSSSSASDSQESTWHGPSSESASDSEAELSLPSKLC